MTLGRRDFLRGLTAGLSWLAQTPRGPAGLWAAERQPAVKRIPTVAEIRSRLPEAAQLVDLLNAHRQQQGLAVIDLSPRLTAVAHFHARDLAEQRPQEKYGSLHSWSDDPRWRGGAYRADDKSTYPIMWDKPEEIAGYGGKGFEICASGARDWKHAFELWTTSETHHNVILNRGLWAAPRWRWQALGAVFYQGYACAWFGTVADG